MSTQEALFWFSSLAGSGLFLVQFVLNLIGADSESSDEASSQTFKWFSKQAITGLLMMFGWVGLACRKELGYSPALSTFAAIGAGLAAMTVTTFIFRFSRKLRSPGTVFRIEESIGKQGSVYQEIPEGSRGKISVSIQDFTHEIDAVSIDGKRVESFTPVQIVKTIDGRTVAVCRIK